MHQASEYILSLRIEAHSIDFDAMDSALGLVGTHQHIDREPTRFRSGLDFDRWEIEAIDLGATAFGSIGEAISAMRGEFLAPVVGDVATAEGRKTYWWCGCFHKASSELTLISERTLDVIGRSHSPFYLNTFHSSDDPDDSDNSGPPFEEAPPDIGRDLPGHQYRFRLSGDNSSLSECEWGPYYEDFSEGLESLIQELTDLPRQNGLGAGAIKKVVCEHVQYAFDGGPTLSAVHAGTIARFGLDMAILWRTAE